MSIAFASSFRLFFPKITQSFHPKISISKTLISSTSNPSKLSFFSSITFQRIPTKPLASSSSSSSYPSSVTSVSLQPIEELPPKLQEIVKLFQAVQEPKAKYEQLLFYGRNLTPLDTQFKTNENKVQGCVSQVWVRAFLDAEKNVRFEADSDSVLTKGLAALLVQGLSGQPISKILKVSPDFVILLGLQQSLTPSRNNGFLNILKLMQKKALQLYIETEEIVSNGKTSEVDSLDGNSKSSSVAAGAKSDFGSENLNSSTIKTGEIKSSGSNLGSRGERIRERLERELHPIELEVEDVSYQHAGHSGVRGSTGETHFNVRVVSKEFEGKSLIKRHQLIYQLLQEELQSGLHALSISAKTPSEIS